MEERPPESGEVLGEIIDNLRNCLQTLSTGQVEERLRDVITNGKNLLIFSLKPKVFLDTCA